MQLLQPEEVLLHELLTSRLFRRTLPHTLVLQQLRQLFPPLLLLRFQPHELVQQRSMALEALRGLAALTCLNSFQSPSPRTTLPLQEQQGQCQRQGLAWLKKGTALLTITTNNRKNKRTYLDLV